MSTARRAGVLGLALGATAIAGAASPKPLDKVAPIVPATAAATAAAVGAPGARDTTPYFTIQFGRTQWVSADKLCKPLQNAVTLGRVATLLQQRGKVASGNVVVKRQGVSQSCFSNYVISPSWNDLTQLRTVYGWTFNSAGMTYANMTTLTPTEQLAEACGSVGALARRGHTRAWGLFAYPNNKYSDKIQTQVVKKCFAFGRQYGDTTTTQAAGALWPNWQTTVSVNGGRCADTTLACSTSGASSTYQTPAMLIPKTRVAAGAWTTMQWYRLVTGTSTTGTVAQWNCTGAENTHWTSDAELYCVRDFLRVIDAIPSTVKVTDAATVAEAWGVKPSGT